MLDCYYTSDLDHQFICPKYHNKSTICKMCEAYKESDIFWSKWFKGKIVIHAFQQVRIVVNSRMSRQSITFLLLLGIVIFMFMYATSVTVVVYSQKLLIGPKETIKTEHLVSICTTAAVATSAIVALFALNYNRLNSEAPWLVSFREFHRDFWNDKGMTKARRWICDNDAYEKELLPVIKSRLEGSILSDDQYQILEDLDRFCAIMLRVVNANMHPMTGSQRQAWINLGYNWWLDELKKREEIISYSDKYWEPLMKAIDKINSNSYREKT